MSLIRFNQKQVDSGKDIFNDDYFWGFPLLPFERSLRGLRTDQWFPAVDVHEDANEITVKADLPGISKEDVHLSFEQGVLTLEGERKYEKEQKEKSFHRVERSYGRFVRSIDLGNQVDATRIKANYKDGVLEVILPKSEQGKAKKIDINVG